VAVDDVGPVMPAEVVTGQEVVVPAGDAGSEQGATRVMTKDEMVEKYGEKMAHAAIGMYMLRTTRARGVVGIISNRYYYVRFR
jgi:hypothetical protein